MHVIYEDDEVIEYRYRRIVLSPGEMFVCPETGLLKTVPERKRPLPNRLILKGMIYILREGSWWELKVRPLDNWIEDQWDVWLEKPAAKISRQEAIKAYGGCLYAWSIRPLRRNEIRELLRHRREASKSKHNQRSRSGYWK